MNNDLELSIFGSMSEPIKDESKLDDEKAKKASDRVKRMRGWLGVKSSVETHNLGGGGDILIDVDAPNGWNR